MNPAMGILLERLGFSTLPWQPVQEKKNSEFEFVKLHLRITIVLHPVCAEGVDR